METVFLAFVLLAIIMAGMAIGVICKGKPIKGSCGGMAALKMDTACDICGGDTKKCEEEQERQEKSKLAYDATKD